MKNNFTKPVIIIRKKIEGENSIEEVARRIKLLCDVEILECPYNSTSIMNVVKNIFFIRKFKFNVVHIISPTEAYLLCFIKASKKIITYHDLGTLNSSRNFLYKIIKKNLYIAPSIHYADEITFVSFQTQREFVEETNFKNINKLHVIYNSYDERLKYVKNMKNNLFTIFHIGTSPRKNLSGMLEACKEIKDIKFIIVGKLTDEQHKKLVKYNYIYENYFDCSFEQIVNFYNCCDLVSFPTFYEGFGLPAIEANAVGKPVIVSDIPIMHEICNDAALFVDPYNQNEIKNAVERIMNDTALQEKIINNGFENIKKFKINNICKQYNDLYKG